MGKRHNHHHNYGRNKDKNNRQENYAICSIFSLPLLRRHPQETVGVVLFIAKGPQDKECQHTVSNIYGNRYYRHNAELIK
jgi:hypothetical protein